MKPSLLERAIRYSTVLAELHGGEGDHPDQRRDHYILVLGAEVTRLREKLQKLGAAMRDEPEDDE